MSRAKEPANKSTEIAPLLPSPERHGSYPAARADWRKHLYIVIFGSDTKAGRLFDIALLISILISLVCVILESIPSLHADHRESLLTIEWIFTGLFTIEYVLRLISTPRPLLYARSFFGIIDLCSILPSFLSLYIQGSQGLIVIRVIRLLRVFRILKLVQYIGEGQILLEALAASRHKITVFIGTIMTLIVIMGSAMYLIEGPKSGYTSIPISMYWAIVTLTTVGYGDITPLTAPGKILASIIMLMGYGILAVPTGIVSVEIGRASQRAQIRKSCMRCGEDQLPLTSRYCFRCGEKISSSENDQQPSDEKPQET